MISESYFWKQPLLEMAERLASLKSSGDLSEGHLIQIERDIFLGFYSVRKLFEAPAKVTDAARAMKIPLIWHPNRRVVNWRNNHKIDELYDLSIRRTEDRNVSFICGRIIHSFVFCPCTDDHGLCGIFFTSDTDKGNRLYYIDIDEVIGIFERVGSDYPSEIHWQDDDGSGKERISAK
jgi:hypothetical protein